MALADILIISIYHSWFLLAAHRFPVGNAEYVKQFLLQYSLLRRKEGFVLRHDSLSAGTEGSCLSDRVMVASAIRLPKQLGHSSLPDMLCTSSGKSVFSPYFRCGPHKQLSFVLFQESPYLLHQLFLLVDQKALLFYRLFSYRNPLVHHFAKI